jgi:hypothetical protein
MSLLTTSVLQASLRADYSIDTTLRDGTRLVLEPCGAVLACFPSGSPPVFMRTMFATSRFQAILHWYGPVPGRCHPKQYS